MKEVVIIVNKQNEYYCQYYLNPEKKPTLFKCVFNGMHPVDISELQTENDFKDLNESIQAALQNNALLYA